MANAPRNGGILASSPRHRVLRCGFVLAWSLASLGAQAQGQAVHVGRFSASSADPPPPWSVLRLDERVPPTRYRVLRWDGVNAVEARAAASMALLARPLDVDLAATPVLCWRWRVDAVVGSADMTRKSGDDYAARVYVAFALPPELLGPGTRAKLGIARALYGSQVPDAAINYVWDNRNPVGTRRPNAYTDRTLMIVQRTGGEKAGQWITERADVLDDARRAFGTEAVRPTLLALAADTDNTGEQVRSGFADLHFVSREHDCDFR